MNCIGVANLPCTIGQDLDHGANSSSISESSTGSAMQLWFLPCFSCQNQSYNFHCMLSVLSLHGTWSTVWLLQHGVAMGSVANGAASALAHPPVVIYPFHWAPRVPDSAAGNVPKHPVACRMAMQGGSNQHPELYNASSVLWHFSNLINVSYIQAFVYLF